MKKICYVVTIPLTIRAFFIPQLNYLVSNGFDVSVICSDDGKIRDDLGEKIRYIPVEMPRGVSVVRSLKAIRELKKIFKREQYDLIQYSTPNAAFYASIAAKQVGCKVRNYHLMGLRFLGASGVGKLILKTIEKISCKNSTDIECVSMSNLKMGISEGLFPQEKAIVVWNGSTGGVNCQRFNYSQKEQWRKEIRLELGYSENDFIYGFVGRVTRDKGINELLESYLKLHNNSKLLLVGPMEEIGTIDEDLLKQASNCSDVLFHDIVADVERYYAAIDVLVLPSYREGFGNVIIEAAAMGTPAIVSEIPGPIDTSIKDITAIWIPSHDSDSLYKSMVSIKTIDYKKMGLSAMEYVKHSFDQEKLNAFIYERKMELLRNKCD